MVTLFAERIYKIMTLAGERRRLFSTHGLLFKPMSAYQRRQRIASFTTTDRCDCYGNKNNQDGNDFNDDDKNITTPSCIDRIYSTNRRVTTKIDSTGICYVQLNRPDKLNSLDTKSFQDIRETVLNLKNDCSVRAIVLSGKGRAFCTGLDVKSVVRNGNPKKQIRQLLERHKTRSEYKDESPVSYDAEKFHDEIDKIDSNLVQDVSILWREINIPVIAVLHGMCYGGGLQIALGADFRFATPDCKLSIMESKWGLIPDMGASILLRELVRIDVAKELTMSGRIISGEEAKILGIVTRACEDPFDEAQRFASELSKRSPDAIAASKHLFQKTWSLSDNNKCLQLESSLQERLLGTWNQFAQSGRSVFGLNIPYSTRK